MALKLNGLNRFVKSDILLSLKALARLLLKRGIMFKYK